MFHVEALIEDLGHIFAGSAASFAELTSNLDISEIDGALIDIDLADGRTGPNAAAWLQERGIPGIFVTGQVEVAAEHPGLVIGTIEKPVCLEELASALGVLKRHLSSGLE
ncbi:MAG: response regulator [Shinella sp.]|nr:response regulator [Shinella sp.]